ncbi:MAG: hypothetical protein M1528_02160 [Candidatus Marsarchaeota archaeon]|nr:hypothetical protein [Candidatus Marsarchaeota archaeon]MCL5115313.1 hypothetical protein [Candidatus Marsarchaeota archaeon]
MNRRSVKAQSALDFLTSYAVIILVVTVAVYAVLELGIFNPKLAPSYCNAAPGFTCAAYSIYTNGTMVFVLSQSIGGTINLTAVACSTQLNGNGSGPKYGNVNMSGTSPPAGVTKGTLLLSNAPQQFSVYCYSGPSNTLAAGSLGSNFIGYIFINYTYSGLPHTYYQIQPVVSLSAPYT